MRLNLPVGAAHNRGVSVMAILMERPDCLVGNLFGSFMTFRR